MNEAESIIYISLGSMVNWQQWYIDTIYSGLIKLLEKRKFKVIWAMNHENLKLPDYDKDVFWIEKWAPQVEILSHPLVKAGITHCGLGGSLEFVYSGVPFLTFPHFGDQGDNANNIVNQGGGLALFDTKKADRSGQEENRKFDSPLFDSNAICDGFDKLLGDKRFAESIFRMKVAAVAAGGAVKAEREIRNYYISSLMLKPGDKCVTHLVH